MLLGKIDCISVTGSVIEEFGGHAWNPNDDLLCTGPGLACAYSEASFDTWSFYGLGAESDLVTRLRRSSHRYGAQHRCTRSMFFRDACDSLRLEELIDLVALLVAFLSFQPGWNWTKFRYAR